MNQTYFEEDFFTFILDLVCHSHFLDIAMSEAVSIESLGQSL